ncbi:NADP-dependent oxidoreductase domain [Trinorchestia longiramus]|nr:NADP-dependent oxidoreductase domain [Trinorchestia longiramus]
MSGSKSITLANGVLMPLIGLGTYQICSREGIYTAVEAALASGYRLIDTASGYRNEEHIGAALRDLLPKFNLRREDIFITSKVGPSAAGDHDSVVSCCKASLAHLGVSYLDLLLVHWPGLHRVPASDARNKAGRLVTWAAFKHLHDSGLVRAVGVSNYEERHCAELLDFELLPHVNQVELHPHYPQTQLLEYCRIHKIAVQAYCSLGSRDHKDKLLHEPAVLEVAAAAGATPAQVLLAWALRQGVGVLPKSTNSEHIASNLAAEKLVLTAEHVHRLDAISTRCKYAWDPATIF